MNATEKIKHERIQAAQDFLGKFPSQDAAAKALGFDGRATAGNWVRIGMPIRVILVADELGYLDREAAVPSVPDWTGYERHHADYVAQQLDKVIRIEESENRRAVMLGDKLRPIIRAEIGHALQILGIIDDSNRHVFIDEGFVADEPSAPEELDSMLE